MSRRLPATWSALSDGTIDLARAKLIDLWTTPLDDDLARAVERKVLVRAGHQTTGQLRASLQRAVISADPAAAERRRTEAEKNARVELSGEESGTAELAGHFLPAAQASAAWTRISALAEVMKGNGAGGGIDLLRAQVFIGLLLGTVPQPPARRPPGSPSHRAHRRTVTAPRAVAVEAPRRRTARAPRPGAVMAPRPGTGEIAHPEIPRPGTAQVPHPGTRQVPRPGTKQTPRPATAQVPHPGRGQIPQPGTVTPASPEAAATRIPAAIPAAGPRPRAHPAVTLATSIRLPALRPVKAGRTGPPARQMSSRGAGRRSRRRARSRGPAGSVAKRGHRPDEGPAPRAERVLADAGRLVGRARPAQPDGRDHGGGGAGAGPGRGGRSDLCVAGGRDRRRWSGDRSDQGSLARAWPAEIGSSAGVGYSAGERRTSPTRTWCSRTQRSQTWRGHAWRGHAWREPDLACSDESP